METWLKSNARLCAWRRKKNDQPERVGSAGRAVVVFLLLGRPKLGSLSFFFLFSFSFLFLLFELSFEICFDSNDFRNL